MNSRAKTGTSLLVAIMMSACATMHPIGFQNYNLESVETILIATDLKDTPVVNFLGVTIFNNKHTHVTGFDFSISQYTLEQSDSILKDRGFSTLINDGPLSETTLRNLRSTQRSLREAAANALHSRGADALFLIEQASAGTGLNFNHGFSLEEHGLFLVNTVAGRRDRVKVPIRITFYDLRNGNLIYREIFDADYDRNYLDEFTHINEAKDVTESDKKALISYYVQKIDSFLEQALVSIKK